MFALEWKETSYNEGGCNWVVGNSKNFCWLKNYEELQFSRCEKIEHSDVSFTSTGSFFEIASI